MQSQKFKETQPLVFSGSSFFFFFSFALLWGGEFRGQPVISGATDLWKAKDVRYASFGECRRGFKMDACSTGDS